MKKYSNYIFNKNHDKLNIDEKFFLTYFIFTLDLKQAIFEFQYESKYKIFNKMTIDDFNNYENRLFQIFLNNKVKISKLLEQYKLHKYYQDKIKKDLYKKNFDNYDLEENKKIFTQKINEGKIKNIITTGVPMYTHGIHGFISYSRLVKYIDCINNENLKFNKVIDENKFEYIFKEKKR